MKKEKSEDDIYKTLPPECDTFCEWRSCLHKAINRGPYVPGRGYTSYYEKPVYCCMTRAQHGCPDGERDTFKRVDKTKMCDDLSLQIETVKATNKVKGIMNLLLFIIRKQAVIIDQVQFQ